MEILFVILMFVIFGRLAFFSVKLAWGVGKVLLSLIFLPFILFMVIIFSGLFTVAIPALIVIGILSLIFVRK